MAMYNVTLFRDVASNCSVSFQTGTMFLVLRNKCNIPFNQNFITLLKRIRAQRILHNHHHAWLEVHSRKMTLFICQIKKSSCYYYDIILIRFGILGGLFVKLQLLMAGYLLTCKTTVCVERRFFFICFDSIVFAILCIIFEFMQSV